MLFLLCTLLSCNLSYSQNFDSTTLLLSVNFSKPCMQSRLAAPTEQLLAVIEQLPEAQLTAPHHAPSRACCACMHVLSAFL
jgi:hypothetical protein